MGQTDNSALRQNLSPYFLRRNDFYDPAFMVPIAISYIMSFQALRGLWPPSSHYHDGSSGYLQNLAVTQAAGAHLTQSGTSQLGLEGGAIPRIIFSGSSQWALSSDAAMWDIIGTEGYVVGAQQGLTIGAWVNYDNAASAHEYALSKRQGAVQISYALRRTDTGYGLFEISNTGTAAVTVDSSSDTIADSVWTFLAGRYTPSTELKLWVNDTIYTNTTSIPASIFSSSADLFMAGRDDAATPGQFLMDGSMSMVWICASAVPDRAVYTLFEISRHIYGV
jgi:hypothetical protein